MDSVVATQDAVRPPVWNPHSHKTATTLLPLVTAAAITGLLSSTFSRETSPPGLGISDAASASGFQFESGPASLPGPGSLFSLNNYAADLSQFQTFCLLGLCIGVAKIEVGRTT